MAHWMAVKMGTSGDGKPIDFPIGENATDASLSDTEEARLEVIRFKNNRTAVADGILAKVFKYGGEELANHSPHNLRQLQILQYRIKGPIKRDMTKAHLQRVD